MSDEIIKRRVFIMNPMDFLRGSTPAFAVMDLDYIDKEWILCGDVDFNPQTRGYIQNKLDEAQEAVSELTRIKDENLITAANRDV